MDKKGCVLDSVVDSAVDSYRSLWQKLNGVNSWEENPFVWVYTFKVIKRPSNFC